MVPLAPAMSVGAYVGGALGMDSELDEAFAEVLLRRMDVWMLDCWSDKKWTPHYGRTEGSTTI